MQHLAADIISKGSCWYPLLPENLWKVYTYQILSPSPKSLFLSFVLCSNIEDFIIQSSSLPVLCYYPLCKSHLPSIRVDTRSIQFCYIFLCDLRDTRKAHLIRQGKPSFYLPLLFLTSWIFHDFQSVFCFFWGSRHIQVTHPNLETHAHRNKSPFLNFPDALPPHLS